jgi:hypothetical protein
MRSGETLATLRERHFLLTGGPDTGWMVFSELGRGQAQRVHEALANREAGGGNGGVDLVTRDLAVTS